MPDTTPQRDPNAEAARAAADQVGKTIIAELQRDGLLAKGENKTLTTLEKGIVTLLGGAALLSLGWMVNTTNSTATSVAVIESQMEKIEQESGDRYTGAMGRAHEREMERRVSRLEAVHELE